MKFRQLLEKREVVNGTEVFINPTSRQTHQLVKKWGNARWIYYEPEREFVIWNGFDATHNKIFFDLYGMDWEDSGFDYSGVALIDNERDVFVYREFHSDIRPYVRHFENVVSELEAERSNLVDVREL